MRPWRRPLGAIVRSSPASSWWRMPSSGSASSSSAVIRLLVIAIDGSPRIALPVPLAVYALPILAGPRLPVRAMSGGAVGRIVRGARAGQDGRMRNGTAPHRGAGYPGGGGHHGGHPPAGRRGRRATRFAVAVRGTLDATRRVLVLVWGTHRGLTTALAVLTLLRSAVPAGEVWLGKLVIDAVAGAITSGEGTDAA